MDVNIRNYELGLYETLAHVSALEVVEEQKRNQPNERGLVASILDRDILVYFFIHCYYAYSNND